MTEISPPTPARFAAPRFCLWLVLAALYAWGIGWASWQLQRATPELALVGIWSLILGAVLGGGLFALALFIRAAHRPTLLGSTLLLAVVTVLAQHVAAYLDYRRNAESFLENDPKSAMAQAFVPEFGPASFGRFMAAAGEDAWPYWTIDGVCILLASGFVVAWASRRPFCDTCRSWFRTVRSGTADAAQLAPVVAELGLHLPAAHVPVEVRLCSCASGCAASRLDVSWVDQGDYRAATRWVDTATRRQLETTLDTPAPADIAPDA